MKKSIITLSLLIVCFQLWAQPKPESITLPGPDGSVSYFSEQLKRLSHDSLEGREALTTGIRKAERIILNELKLAGVQAMEGFPDYRQKVPLSMTNGPENIFIRSGTDLIADVNNAVLLAGKDLIMESEIVFIGQGSEEDILKRDLKNKIVITQLGDGQQKNPAGWMIAGIAKRAAVRKAGGIALIELFEPGRFPWQMIKGYLSKSRLTLQEEGSDFPHFWLNISDTLQLRSITRAETRLSLEVSGFQNKVSIDHNLIGFIPGTDPGLVNEMVVFSAHYDHVGIGRPDTNGDSIYNGARDNAIGVVTLLGLARHFKINPPSRPVLLVFFTAEEKGLLGSEYFIHNSPVPLHRIRFNFNCDNGGYTDTDLLTVIGHHRLDGLQDIDQWLAPAGLRHFEPIELATRLFHASDNIHFANQGIPAPSVGMGFTGFTEELTRYYHKPADHWENFDPAYMAAYWMGVRNLAIQLINLDELPFWKAGDPLFEKGKTLYKEAAK